MKCPNCNVSLVMTDRSGIKQKLNAMQKIILTTLMLMISYFGQLQNHLTSEVIEKAKLYLKNAVGKELYTYFKLDPISYYERKS